MADDDFVLSKVHEYFSSPAAMAWLVVVDDMSALDMEVLHRVLPADRGCVIMTRFDRLPEADAVSIEMTRLDTDQSLVMLKRKMQEYVGVHRPKQYKCLDEDADLRLQLQVRGEGHIYTIGMCEYGIGSLFI